MKERLLIATMGIVFTFLYINIRAYEEIVWNDGVLNLVSIFAGIFMSIIMGLSEEKENGNNS